MKIKSVTRKLPEYKKIIDLYKNSFPQDEKMPVFMLQMFALRKNVKFYAFYDNNVFVGFTYLINFQNMTYVMYLATDANMRSKGYGRKILHWISHKYPQNNIVLSIEKVDEKFENYEQRLKRQSFYYKNGFKHTGYTIYEFNVLYDLLYKGKSFSDEEFQKLYNVY